jgi:hypothetical protein
VRGTVIETKYRNLEMVRAKKEGFLSKEWLQNNGDNLLVSRREMGSAVGLNELRDMIETTGWEVDSRGDGRVCVQTCDG